MFTTPKEQRPIVMVAALLLLGLQLVVVSREWRAVPAEQSAFAGFYGAGEKLRSGHGGDLYAIGLWGRSFDRPAYEAAVFVPLSLGSVRSGYFGFLAVNVGLLFVCLYLLRPYFENFEKIWRPMPVAVFFCFLPITLSLVAGDDSILLLTLMVAAAVSFYREQDLRAGLFLGLGIFGWQFAIPIVVTFSLWRRWKISLGFIVGAAAVSSVSVMVAGWSGMLAYLHLSMQHFGTMEGWRQAGMIPNLRCFLYAVAGWLLPVGLLLGLIVTASVALILWASTRTTNFALATMVAVLISYHGRVQQAALLIIPIAFVLDARLAIFSGWTRTMTRNIVIGLLIFPTVLYFLRASYCWMVVLMLPTLLPLRFASSDWQPTPPTTAT